MKILICDGLHESGIILFHDEKGLEVDMPDQPSSEEVKSILPDYAAMIVRSRTKVTADLLENAANLKVIGRAGTGVDNIDIGAASKRGILVVNTPGANAMAAAEHTMALMLALARHVPQATQSMREGKWEKKKFMGTELYQQTLGVIGIGKIGSIVARRALAMEMEVIAYDPHISAEATATLGVKLVSFDDLLKSADFITVHTPLTAETRNIINRNTLSRTKTGVRIINCARGEMIDEKALYDALAAGHVAGAALDVFAQEPPRDNPLLQLPTVIFTPHLGASSVQAQENVARSIAAQIIAFLKRGIIRNAVNFPSISTKDYERIHPYLNLAERLGSLQGQLCQALERVEIEYSGSELMDLPLDPITQTVAKGLLDPVLTEKVNFVNAPVLLKERKIELVASSTSETRGYTGLIRVTVQGRGERFTAAGTVFSGKELRLVRLFNYRLETELEGINLIIQNLDKPGMIGFIGSTLGNFQINIANMHLSRTPKREKAIAIVRLDHEAPPETIRVLRSHPNILSVEQVILPSGVNPQSDSH